MLKTWNQVILVNLALAAVGLRTWFTPWPAPGDDALLDLVRETDPLMHHIFAEANCPPGRLPTEVLRW